MRMDMMQSNSSSSSSRNTTIQLLQLVGWAMQRRIQYHHGQHFLSTAATNKNRMESNWMKFTGISCECDGIRDTYILSEKHVWSILVLLSSYQNPLIEQTRRVLSHSYFNRCSTTSTGQWDPMLRQSVSYDTSVFLVYGIRADEWIISNGDSSWIGNSLLE